MSYTSQTLTKTRYLSSVTKLTSTFDNNAIGLTTRPNLLTVGRMPVKVALYPILCAVKTSLN